MKKLIFIFLIGCFIIPCSAQTRLVAGEMKAKHDTFIVKEIDSKLLMDSIKRIVVYSKSNLYNKGIPYSEAEKNRRFLPMNPKKDTHVDNGAVKQIVYNVLNNKLSALKKNAETMDLILVFHPDGKLTDVAFGLRENTLVTLQDIEEIDRRLRTEIKASFTGKQYAYYIAINYYIPTIIF
jgi:hypothetical protein